MVNRNLKKCGLFDEKRAFLSIFLLKISPFYQGREALQRFQNYAQASLPRASAPPQVVCRLFPAFS
jgi:hypothetical protein